MGGGRVSFSMRRPRAREDSSRRSVNFRACHSSIGLRCKHPSLAQLGNLREFLKPGGLLIKALTMPSLTATRLIAEYGSDLDYKFAGSVQLKTATTLGSTFGTVHRYEPWNNASAKTLLVYHPVAVWKQLSVRLAPRSGIYGRMCTFYGGWAASALETPTTVDDMVNLHGAIDVTYGGTGDPGTVRVEIPCQFDDTMKDLLKGPDNQGSRPVFFYCFVESAVVDKPTDSDRFMLTFKGSYTLHGRY